jgi:hypothetical protein
MNSFRKLGFVRTTVGLKSTVHCSTSFSTTRNPTQKATLFLADLIALSLSISSHD